jgi:GT2 family glycosyltransferase
MRQVSVIILAYGDEPLLVECVTAVLDSHDVEVELLVVDNGSPSISRVALDPRLRVITPGENTGFAGGCNLAAAQAGYDTFVFVNSDLIVHPDAIAVLTSRLVDAQVGLVTGAVLMPGVPLTVNSIGNPIHYLLFSWAGDYGEPFADHDTNEEVTGISGAFFASRRDHWEWLDGFDEQFFAYAEDADLSLRTWQTGKTVKFEPRAIGVHHYAFTKNNNKWFLLERNRLVAFFTLYDRRSIWLLLPVVIPVEMGVFASAVSNGWAKEKLASWCWLWGHRAYLQERRRRVADRHVAPLRQWTDVMSGEMHIPDEFGLRVPAPVNWVLGRYWDLIKPFIK